MDINILGPDADASSFTSLQNCSDGRFVVGKNGVVSVLTTGDGKVEFIFFANHVMAYVNSMMGYPAYYPVLPVKMEKPIKAVLMDLDGTSVRSEEFWIWIIQKSIADLLDKSDF